MSVWLWFTQTGWKVLLVIAICVALYFLLRYLVPPFFKRMMSRRMKGKPEEEIEQRTDTLSRVTVNTGIVIVAIIGLFMLLDQVGVNIATALVGLGIVGLAVSFGAQSLIRDLIAGIFILMENQYSIGDVVRIADTIGAVEEITLRRTVLRDLDGTVHSVPNGEIKVASNLTKEWARVNINVSVAYGVDLDQAIAIINREGEKMAQDPRWKDDIISPPQFLGVDELGDSGIALKILGDTKPLKQWDVMRELRKRIKEAFDAEDIEIPWPHIKIYFGEPLKHQPMIKEGIFNSEEATDQPPHSRGR